MSEVPLSPSSEWLIASVNVRDVPAQSHVSSLEDMQNYPASSVDAAYLGDKEAQSQQQVEQALGLFMRALKPLGLLRVAMTDLDELVHTYLFKWRSGDGSGETRSHRLNAVWRGGGERTVFNEEDLSALLRQAGFVDIRRFIPGSSSESLFWGAEQTALPLLVLEARKPAAV